MNPIRNAFDGNIHFRAGLAKIGCHIRRKRSCGSSLTRSHEPTVFRPYSHVDNVRSHFTESSAPRAQ